MNVRPWKSHSPFRQRAFAVAGVAFAALSSGLVFGVVHAASASTAAARSPSRATPGRHARRRPVPAWAKKCLPKGQERVGPAPKYVGLTPAAASRRARHRRDGLVFAGGGGRCSNFNDQVVRAHPIAVVYNTRLIRDPRARIIAAVRAAPGWHP